MAALAVPAGGLAAVGVMHYVITPVLHGRHIQLPSPIMWAFDLAAVAFFLPELYLLVKAASNIRDEEIFKRYRLLMIAWPYALVAPYIAVMTRALPRGFLSDDDGASEPAKQATGTPLEQPINEQQMSTKDWSDAYRAQRAVLADLKKQVEVQDTMSRALWDVAQEARAHADGKVVKQDS